MLFLDAGGFFDFMFEFIDMREHEEARIEYTRRFGILIKFDFSPQYPDLDALYLSQLIKLR